MIALLVTCPGSLVPLLAAPEAELVLQEALSHVQARQARAFVQPCPAALSAMQISHGLFSMLLWTLLQPKG